MMAVDFKASLKAATDPVECVAFPIPLRHIRSLGESLVVAGSPPEREDSADQSSASGGRIDR